MTTRKRPIEGGEVPMFGDVSETPPLLIRRRMDPTTAAEIRAEIEGSPVEPIARGGTPELLFPPPRGSTPYAELPVLGAGGGSGASTVVYEQRSPPRDLYEPPRSRAISVRSSPSPTIVMPSVVSDGGAAAAVRLVGDKQSLIAGYQKVSLCHSLAAEAVQRARAAADILDADHREQILGMLQVAGLTNANATSRKLKRIPLKKAISIATKAETWVYQQQAAAAKHAAKEARKCLSKLSGRHKLTMEEKQARYQRRYGVARGTRSERAIRKYERKIAKIRGV